MDYKTSGVDIEAGRAFVGRIKSSVEATHQKEVIGGLGGFGGAIRLPDGFSKPVLVAGADGVGTKLQLAQENQSHFGVGIDLVAMCVNDVITSGAKPFLFLDYIATGTLSPEALAEVVEGIAEGCARSDCSLLGGETAEMPGFYLPGTYDLGGFCVGIVEESNLINGSAIKAGDQIIGIESSGVHSNGFSLVRKVMEMAGPNNQNLFDENQTSLIEALLKPTALYVELVTSLLEDDFLIHGMAHITGGGLPENLPRCIPEGCSAFIDTSSWERPEIFNWLQSNGDIPELDMWNTFNLGVGFCLVVDPQIAQNVLDHSANKGLHAWSMGFIQESSQADQKILGLPL